MRVADPRRTALAGAAALLLAWPAAAEGRAACGDAVTVAPGDTLAGIAQRCGSGLDALLRANPQIDDPRQIRPGAEVRLPDAAAGPTAKTAAPRPPAGGNRDGLTRDGYRPPVRGVQGLMLTPRSGTPGSTVTVEVMGLPPGPAVLGAGVKGADWQKLTRITVPDSGTASVEVAVPGWAVPGDPLVFTIQPSSGPPLGSGTYEVVAPTGPSRGAIPSTFEDGVLSAAGQLRRDGACILLQTRQGHLYALAGDWSFTPGAAVLVTGRAGGGGTCGGARGTIEVSALRPSGDGPGD